MLQTNSTDNWTDRDNVAPEFRPGPVVSLTEVLAVLAFIRRHLLITLLACFAALGVAILYLVIVTPTFTARAQLIVNAKGVDAAAVSTVVETQIGIIKSESIANAVIEKLGLAQDPEFTTGQGSGMISRVLGWARGETKVSGARYALESFERKFSAKRLGPTFLVEIAFDSKDPDRAAQILNAVAEKYISRQMDAALLDETWVKKRLNELSAQALAAQKAFEDYSKNGKEPADSTATIDKLAAAVDSSKNAYDNFRHMLRKMEATQQQSSPGFEASLVTGASPPLRASSPRPRSVLVIAIVGGLLLGIAMGIVRDLSVRIRTSGPNTRPSAEDDRTEQSLPDELRPDHQYEASAKAKSVRLAGSG
ncbi:Wzz/FepE/Etk N-terminal domain-containing protein [Bradyrhizobium iriomotense]|uniref:Polysaccharide chain length determinant N-terminal domain-containing protein n=1 Tax=Bradyrhizobium iriomotense TaxID=441950 RepID=A0ABQ6AYG4_9BRAD|nr:Wzz/FepE/Etk N-terminal domain-containing protein [Bradyrhizobium iriomotense]GLR86576.1 hypothetical protein GCM10007857_32870 [Bradyrhizobium iriomotense]